MEQKTQAHVTGSKDKYYFMEHLFQGQVMCVFQFYARYV